MFGFDQSLYNFTTFIWIRDKKLKHNLVFWTNVNKLINAMGSVVLIIHSRNFNNINKINYLQYIMLTY